ncbi:alpha/beta fold hydrolase [Roseivivax sp. CAU 1761]
MAEFLLIHGSCHGAWCWDATIAALAARGHAARAIDLPGHGADRTAPGGITLDLYAEAIRAALRPGDVLVGHSMAGYPISRTADLDPSGIARLVYLAAYVPAPGASLVEMRRRAPRQPILGAIDLAEDGRTFSIRPEAARDVFYQDCPPAAVARALDLLCPKPVAPQATPLTLGANWQAVPRSYIICEEDNAVPTELQREMAPAAARPEHIHSLPGSHSPFMARPEALADLLGRIAAEG